MRFTGKHCKLSNHRIKLNAMITLGEIYCGNSGILSINCTHLYNTSYSKEMFLTSRSQMYIFHYTVTYTKSLYFPICIYSLLVNEGFPHALYFLNSEVTACKCNLVNVKSVER